MTEQQAAVVITILKSWLGASVLVGAAIVAFQFAVWLGVVLAIAALLVVLLGLGASTKGQTIATLTEDR